MPKFVLEDRYLIGDATIDDHHRHLVGLLNKAYDDFLLHGPSRDLNVLLHEMIDYATYHFFAEEQLMQGTSYPQTSAHQREHAEFSKRVVEMQAEFERRKLFFLELLSFLYEWLTTHILQTDAEFGRFLKVAARKSVA